MEFELKEEYIELIKLLKVLNLVGSGGEAKMHVASGTVTLNGEVETRKRCKIRKGDIVKFNETFIKVV